MTSERDGIEPETPLPPTRVIETIRGSEAVLQVYQAGELTVVGFGNKDVPSEICIAEYRDSLIKLLAEHRCRVLAVDATGVSMMPSGVLGLLSTLRKKVDRLEIYNPSRDVLATLRLTRLDTLMEIHEVEPPH